MEEQNNRSSKAQKQPVNQNSKPKKVEELDNCDEKMKKADEQSRVSSGTTTSSGCTFDKVSAGKTLTSVPLWESGSQFDESSHLLSEVPVEYSLQPVQSIEELKDQVRPTPLKSTTGQSAQIPLLSPTSVSQSVSSISNPNLPEQTLHTVKNGKQRCLTQEYRQNSPGSKPSSSVPALKTTSDGYNWRKYGQKQVKNPEGFRSYYRCTFSECCAKKIECCDRSSRVIETVYRNHHNHDPPQKLNCSSENRHHVLAVVPFNRSSDTAQPVRGHSDLAPSTSPKESIRRIDQTPETTKQQEVSCSGEIMDDVKEESVDGPEHNKRQKRSSTGELGSVPKPGNKPKFVVHAPGDVGVSGDGYRWRKYGQKMVKGNSHPRNYYRCTSAGCPVRKQIERAVDNTGDVLITYKGGHDHDMPVPRKRHGPKSAPLLSTKSPVTVNNLHSKTNAHQSQVQCSVQREGESAGETLKTSESTKTLLSIGFEIKPC